jgi:hypothetical protein
MRKQTGYVIHEGRTENGFAFVAIATLKTNNRKTGDMVQIWFLLRDINPVDVVTCALDASTICAECPFASGKGCYVNVGQAPLAVWKAYHRGAYSPLLPKDYAGAFEGRKVRFGAYGNPSLLPVSIVKAIAETSEGWTGYFHDWRTNRYATEYSRFFMASTETESSFRLASSLGLRTFHASPVQPQGTVECLSDSTNGRVNCAQCKLACNGLSSARPSVWINPHGSKVARAIAATAGVN